MNVKELREKNKLSQQELSDKTGIPKDRIAKWEQGKGAPKAADSKILDKFFKELVPRGQEGDGYLLQEQELPLPGDKRITADKYFALMEERLADLKVDKEWLKRQIEFSLAGLIVGQKSVLAHVSTILEKDNERDAGGDKKKEKKLKDDSDKRIVEKIVGHTQKDTAQGS